MSAAMGFGTMAGSLVKGFMGASQKKDEAAIHKYNARVMRQEAEAIKKRTVFQQARFAESAARTQGNLEAGLGGSGTVSTQDAGLLALALQKQEDDIQGYLIGLQGRMKANQALSTADEYDMMYQSARKAARQSMKAGVLNAGASAMSTYASWPEKEKERVEPFGGGQGGGFGGGGASGGWGSRGYSAASGGGMSSNQMYNLGIYK